MQKRGFLECSITPTFLASAMQHVTCGMTGMTENNDLAALFQSSSLGPDDVPGWEYDSGLWRRNVREQKWFFYYLDRGETMRNLFKTDAPIIFFEKFLRTLNDTCAAARAVVQLWADEFDRKHPLASPSGALGPRVNTGKCVTRVLRYLPRAETADDATVHIDRSACTVHWKSTRQGLRIFDPNREVHEAKETADDTIAIFPGKKFAAVTRGVFGFGTPHGVKEHARIVPGAEDRFALVSFVHIPLSINDVAWYLAHQNETDALEKRCIMT